MVDIDDELDELDVKFFENFPIIVDTFTTSSNRLFKLLGKYFSVIEKRIDDFISIENNWVKKSSYKNDIRLFSFKNRFNSKKLLEPVFYCESGNTIEQNLNNTLTKGFFIAIGFWYQDELNPLPLVYFGIYRYDVKSEEVKFPLEFYDSLNANDFKKRISYPSKGDNEETIEIWTENINQEEIEKGFQIFKDNILESYLQNIK